MSAPVSVYAEMTPNPSAMKFVANRMLVKSSYEFFERSAASASPLAQQLFEFSCVSGVFLSENFVTIIKTKDTEWEEVMTILREFIQSYLNGGEAVMNEDEYVAPAAKVRTQIDPANLSDIELQIADVIEEYIKPAIQMDGGAIEFRSFENGVVFVKLRGACSGCPSSTVTLKSGIENLLKRMVPEVQEVVSEI